MVLRPINNIWEIYYVLSRAAAHFIFLKVLLEFTSVSPLILSGYTTSCETFKNPVFTKYLLLKSF